MTALSPSSALILTTQGGNRRALRPRAGQYDPSEARR